MTAHKIAAALIGFCVAGQLPSMACAASAQFPTKAVRWIVPYAAGGPTDLIGRIVGQKATEIWGQPVVVDSRPGANSIIGTDLAAHAPADGYTMLMALPALTINPGVYRKLPYDVLRDFMPVTMLASASYLVLVNAALQVNSVQELVAIAKAQPGKLSFGSGGVASPAHLATELLMQRTGIRMVHVPYKGGAPALIDLVSGQIQVLVNPALSALPYVKGGKLRVIAVTGAKRSAQFPNVPSVAEAGLAGYDVGTWYGLFVPRGTPAAVVQFTYRTVEQALRDEQVRNQLVKLDAVPVGSAPADFSRFVREELKTWSQITKAAKIEVTGE